MKKRYSRNHLFRIRNTVPINYVIQTVLGLVVKTSDGILRFLCPVCNEFQTATNPSTNLARCFRCEKNFNVIDIYMLVKGTGFVETVKCLEKLLPAFEETEKPEKRDIKKLIDGIGKPMI